MTVSDLEHFRDILIEREHNLRDWINSRANGSEDNERKVRLLLEQIKDAFVRIENGNYGTCTVCKGEVELHRLEVQPVTQVCLDCLNEKEQELLEEELLLASKVHRALLPQAIERIEGFEVAVKSAAARTVGGDYYDFLRSNAGETVRIVIADVMGKGIPAGMVMSNLQSALRILSEETKSTALLITRLNRWLTRNIPVTKFISLACVELTPDTKSDNRLVYSNAGHCPLILMRKDGSVNLLQPTGGVLGVNEEFNYEERHLVFSTGDLLVLYTDGVTEALDKRGEMFGEERLTDFIRNHSKGSLDALVSDLVSEIQLFSEKPVIDDDFAVIAIRKKN